VKSIKKAFVRIPAGPMAALLLLIMLLPGALVAAELQGTSNTYLQSRETADGTKQLPLYEYLDLSVRNMGAESVSIHFGGWLGYDLRDDAFGSNNKNSSDLQYGYVSLRTKSSNAMVNVGRVMVFEGVAAERVDGIYARTDVKGGFGIAAFGGAPVETGTDTPGNNVVYGGRISHQYAGLYAIGLSYLKEEKNSATFREEEGIDLWLRPVNKVELTGRSSYNANNSNANTPNVNTSGWMEHAYYLGLGPFAKLRLNTEASWISYGAYFAGATTNVFRMTPGGPINPNEKVKILGEEAVFALTDSWTLSADYKSYSYDIAGNAASYGAKLTFAVPKSYRAGLSFRRMDGDTTRLQYDEYRVYAAKKIHKVDLAVDLLDVKYQQAINGVTNAYAATLAAGYEFTEKLSAGADVEYSKNPDFDKDVRLFLKLNYHFDSKPGKDAGKKKGA
jgi:hypothetical protein